MGNDVKGALCIQTSIPSMSRTIYGHHQRFLDTYYNPFKGIGFHTGRNQVTLFNHISHMNKGSFKYRWALVVHAVVNH